jgi:hypothetical protein
MKIHIEEHYGEFWAFDDDTYDGAPDAHCPVGVGLTDYAAINDLMEQVVDELEERLEGARFELACVKAENKSLREEAAGFAERIVKELNLRVTKQIEGKSPETDAQDARGDLQIQKQYQHTGGLLRAAGEAYSEVVTQDEENAGGFQGRMPDEPPEWDSGYDEDTNRE